VDIAFQTLSDTEPTPYGPHLARSGNLLWLGSIDPVRSAADLSSGVSAIRPIEAQARESLERLKAILETGGSSLREVLKVDVHLADPSDFYEFQLVWREYFPADPPARTVVVVGDTFPARNQLMSIDAVALTSAASSERESLSSSEVPEPAPAEWAPYAVKAGPLIFCSGFPATDFKTGLAVVKHPDFPNYGNDAELQADFILGNLNKVLAKAGTSLVEALEAQLYEPDLSTFHSIDRIWSQYMPVPPARSSMGVHGLLVPGAAMVANLVVLAPDSEHQKDVSTRGIRWHPTQARGVHFSPTVTAGPWRFLAGQIATPDFSSYVSAPCGLPYHFSDIEIQTEFIMQLLAEQLEANETSLSRCVHARVYLMYPRRDIAGFLRIWKKFFPNPENAPVLAFVPTTGIMFPGPIIEIDLTAVSA